MPRTTLLSRTEGDIRSQPKATEILMKEDSFCRAEFKANKTRSSVPHQFCQQILKGAAEFTKVQFCIFLLFIQKLVKKYF